MFNKDTFTIWSYQLVYDNWSLAILIVRGQLGMYNSIFMIIAVVEGDEPIIYKKKGGFDKRLFLFFSVAENLSSFSLCTFPCEIWKEYVNLKLNIFCITLAILIHFRMGKKWKCIPLVVSIHFLMDKKWKEFTEKCSKTLKSMQCFFFPSKAIKLELPQMPPYLALSTKITLSK